MEKSNINQAKQSMSSHPLQGQKYDLVIVGSGISCAYTLINYISLLEKKYSSNSAALSQPIKVIVIDKFGEFWTGIPYGTRTGKQSLIITSLEEFLPQSELNRFVAWLTNNYDEVLKSLKARPGILAKQWLQSYQDAIAKGEWNKLFIPRYIYGWYVRDYVKESIEKAKVQRLLDCELLQADVTNIKKSQDDYRVEFNSNLDSNSWLNTPKVVLAIGSPPNRFPCAKNLTASSQDTSESQLCFINNMYEPTQNINIENIIQTLQQSNNPTENQVLIVGSNASALETIYSLKNLPEVSRLIRKFIVISPNGKFPHRISDLPHTTNFVPKYLTTLNQSPEQKTAKQILESVKRDVASALEQGETVHSTYKIISREVISSLNQLCFDEQKQFVIKYGVEIGKYQRRAGTDYLNLIDKLIFQDKLFFLQGKFVRLTSLDNGQFGFEFLTKKQQLEQFNEPIRVIVNCAGFQDLNQSSSPLIRNLIQQGICIPNDSLCGFNINENFEANHNLYLMGPLMAGNINERFKIWHAESCGRIINLSQQLAESLC